MKILLKKLLVNDDTNKDQYVLFLLEKNTKNIKYYSIITNLEKSKYVTSNTINRTVHLGLYYVNLFKILQDSSYQLMYTGTLDTSKCKYGNFSYFTKLYRVNENIVNIDMLNQTFYMLPSYVNNSYIELEYLIKNSNNNNVLEPIILNLDPENMIYTKYSKVVTYKTKDKIKNSNTFLNDFDTYSNNVVLVSCFSDTTNDLSQINLNDIDNKAIIKLLNESVNIVNKNIYKYGNKIYLPYDGQLVGYKINGKSIVLHFINNYFIPDSYIERSLKELTYGHRDQHIYYDTRYLPQKKILLEFFITILTDTNTAKFHIDYTKNNYYEKSSLICTIKDSGTVISSFNRPLRFLDTVKPYLDLKLDCLMKCNDLVAIIN